MRHISQRSSNCCWWRNQHIIIVLSPGNRLTITQVIENYAKFFLNVSKVTWNKLQNMIRVSRFSNQLQSAYFMSYIHSFSQDYDLVSPTTYVVCSFYTWVAWPTDLSRLRTTCFRESLLSSFIFLSAERNSYLIEMPDLGFAPWPHF